MAADDLLQAVVQVGAADRPAQPQDAGVASSWPGAGRRRRSASARAAPRGSRPWSGSPRPARSRSSRASARRAMIASNSPAEALVDERQRLGRGLGLDHGDAPAQQVLAQHRAAARVVLDQQHARAGQRRDVLVAQRARLGGERQREEESRALARLADQADACRPSARPAACRSTGRGRCRRTGASSSCPPARRTRIAARSSRA